MENIITKVFSGFNMGEKLHDFYYNTLIQSKYRYIIIVPRKCLTEYKCLCTQYSDLKIGKDKFYMTSKSYIRYKEQMLNEIREGKDISILIMDDIMMYGRGISTLLKEMLEGVEAPTKDKLLKRIYVSVFIENGQDFSSDSKELQNEALEDILENRYNRYFSFRNAKDINRASDLFLESFYATATSNTSFVNTWYCKNNDFLIADSHDVGRVKLSFNTPIENDKGPKYYPIKSNDDQIRNSFYSGVYYEADGLRENRWAEFSCMRVYHNKKLQKSFLIPYVFLKPMKEEQINKLLESLSQILIFSDTWKEWDDSEQAYILKYEYLTNLLSDCYGAYFYTKYLGGETERWDNIFYEELIAADFSFGRGNVLSIEGLCDEQKNGLWEKVTKRCNDILTETADFFDQEKVSLDILKEVIANGTACDGILKSFLDKSNMKDTLLAKEGKGKHFGISTISMRILLEQEKKLQPEEIADLYGELICHMDQGGISVKAELLAIGDKKYYGSLVSSGEQAYRAFQETADIALHYFAKIEDDCINLFMPDRIELKIDEFISYYGESYTSGMMTCKELMTIRKGVRGRRARYSDYDIVRRKGLENQGLIEKFEQAYEKIRY